MKANSRRRVLISSLAMLLVALVALSTATYAWFTSDPTANASGLKVKATAATGLVIKSATEGQWTHSATLNKDGNDYAADPLSIDPTQNTVVGYKTVAAADNASDADTTKAVTTSTAYYSEVINAKITGTDATSASVKITDIGLGDGSWASAGLRMAVTYTDVDGEDSTTTLIGIFSDNGASNKYLTATGAYAESISEDAYTFATSTATTVTVDNTGDDYFTVFVYLDGEDANVFTDNIVTLGNLAGNTGVNIDFAIA